MRSLQSFSKRSFRAWAHKCVFITIICCFFSPETQASNYFWVGGSGNWSNLSHWATTSGGTTLHSQIPTALDDVFFDANSFTAVGQVVTLDPLTILVHDMNWTGVTNTPTVTGSSAALLKIYGTLKFVAGMNMNFAGDINFEATATGQTITMAGKSFLRSVVFNGVGGSWAFQDAFKTTGSIALNHGILTTNNQTVNASSFISYPSSSFVPRTLNLGSSVINFSGGVVWNVTQVGLGLTINSGTSVINATSASANFTGGGGHTYYDVNFTNTAAGALGRIGENNNVYHDVIFSADGYIGNDNAFHNVTYSRGGDISGNISFNNLSFTAGYTYVLWSTSVITVNGIWNVAGTCGAFIDMHTQTPGSFATVNHPAGAVNISYAILKDIHAGGGGTFIANNSIDLGNNTGWTINSPAVHDLYWIGNSGNWDDGNHWSLSSGGLPSGCSPTPTDNVFFDANSFSAPGQAVNINVPTVYCRDMTWTGVSNNPSLAGPLTNLLKIHGSLTFASAMNLNFLGQVNFESTVAGKTITMNGKIFNDYISFNGTGGWTLQDAFSTLKRIILNRGILTTNNKTVNAYEFYSISPFNSLRTLNMGSSVFNLSGGGQAWFAIAAGFTLNSGTSVINCNSSAPGFIGGNLVYYDLNFTNPNVDGSVFGDNVFHDAVFAAKTRIAHSNTFHNATFLGHGEITDVNTYTNLTFTAPYTYLLGVGKTQTVTGTFTANGTCNSLVTINSTVPNQSATLSHPAGTVNISFTILKDIIPAGGAVFNAANSVDMGNNAGWNFISPTGKDLYWVGNTGDWNDGGHWALTSGGTPSGCSPSPIDNVFFDANSFSSAGKTVTITAPTAYCRNMSWTGVTNLPTFTGSATPVLKIYGSIVLAANMNQNFLGDVEFEATSTGKAIAMLGKTFKKNVNFRGFNGGWTFQDAFGTAGTIELNYGVLTTNDQTVNASAFISYPLAGLNIGARTLNMGTSVFNLSSSNVFWNVTPANSGLTINCGTSVINSLSVGNGDFRAGGNHTYYDLKFLGNGPTAKGFIGEDNNHFHDVLFSGDAYIGNNQTFHDVIISRNGLIESGESFHDLTFTAGYTYTLGSNTIQTISNNWKVQGSCTLYIVLESTNQGVAAKIVKPSGSVLGYNIHIQDIKCSGGANFIAYNSVDLGGNAGWAFSSLPPLLNPNLIIGPSSVCPGSTNVVYHIPPVQGAIGYLWTVPAGATIVSGQGDTLIVVNFGSAVSGNISVQSFNGCNYGLLSSSLTLVTGVTVAPVVTLGVLPTGPVCPGTPVTFTATALPGAGGGAMYDFKVNGSTVQHTSSNMYTTANSANGDHVTCILTTGSSACTGSFVVTSNTITMSVYPQPVISFNPISATIISGNAVQLYANVTGNISTYLWTPPDALSNTAISNPIANPLHITTYTLKVTSADNCPAEGSITVTVMPNCSVSIPNAFSPNGDGINDKWVIARGTCIEKFQVSVYNRYGSLVYHSNNYQSDWDGTYSSKSLPDGTYYYVAKAVNFGIEDGIYRGDITILR